MAKWYEASISYVSFEDGAEKDITEKYLVEDETVGCAEKRLYEELGSDGTDIRVDGIVGKKIEKVIFGLTCEDGLWYRCKVMFVTVDEKTGKEKKTASIYMVQSFAIEPALEIVKKELKDSVTDWQINTIQETAIVSAYKAAEKE